ncbi:MAG: MFS transporter [Opitutaceae bacterium]|jgi:sugar phosphate permease|nr:MFS transporter [Opitutaceae bacterium]
MPPKTQKPLHARYKWELLALLCLAFFFHQGDRAIFGVVLPQIRADLGLTGSQEGLVGSVLFFTLAVLMPFAGFAGDRFPKTRVITACLLFWSTATLFTGFAGGVVALVALRSVATAGGEAFYAPSAYSLLAKFHRSTRSIAMSVHQAALYIGVITSGFLGGWIADRWGWRSAFYVFGACGIALGVVFALRLRDTPDAQNGADAAAGLGVRQPSAALENAGEIRATGLESGTGVPHSKAGVPPASVAPTFSQSLALIFRTPTALLLTVAFTGIVCVNNAYVVWAPSFLQDKFHLSLTLAGGYAMLFHHLAAMAGVLAGGAFSDFRARTRPTARLELQTLAMLLGAPAILWMALAPSLVTACLAMGLFGLFRGLYECNTHASLFDVIPPRSRATAVSVMTMLAFLVGSLSPLALGKAKDFWPDGSGLSRGFAALAALYVIGAAAVAFARARTFRRDRINESAS